MTWLVELAKTVRSKNAGPDLVTFDIIFDNKENYERVKNSGVLSKSLVANLYNIDEDKVVEFVVFDQAMAIKFTILRENPAGSVGERDLMGAQQYPPLFEIEIP